jgi:GAF domain-containing protein
VTVDLGGAPLPDDLDAALSGITAAAVEVIPSVSYASITVKHADGTLETVAPTTQLILELDAAQYELQEGPCYDAATSTVHVISPKLAADERFPRYGEIAVNAGIRAQAGIRLFETGAATGALNLYSLEVGAFEDLGILGDLFAHQAGMAIDYAREVENLQAAVEARSVIGRAVGIIMERFSLSDARAFAFLVRRSQQENIKVRKLAEDFISRSQQEYDGE